MRKMFVLIAVLCILVPSCSGNTESAETVVDVECSSGGYNERTGALLEEWEGVITVSLQRFPGRNEQQIKDMERILGEFKNLDIPDCYQPAHDKYLSGMDYDLEGVKEFDETGDVSDKFELADEEYAAAQEELTKLDK